MMAIGIGQPVYPFNDSNIKIFAPHASGVYAICNAYGTYVYFGESEDIQRRLLEHLSDYGHCMHVHGAASFAFQLANGQLERVLIQNALIQMHPTPCNQKLG